ncbi:hypothetical protein [Spiroplasma tabanidicola]|uniref:hypothetical protein n=1 Tax=Spiroplasma tabanidicola TaxID=324079 RepID=UPI0012DEAF82|nr:hypothetical protein [Spiroplasma tabanidicola]
MWDDAKIPVEIICIAHDLCRHAFSHSKYAKYLNKMNWLVIGSDRRRHGKTAN